MNRVLLIVFSYHQKNTQKIAERFAGVLGADIRSPLDIDPEDLHAYSLVGFGSGIYDAKNHVSLLDLADRLPQATGGKAFIFSTDGVPRSLFRNGLGPKETNHSALRTKLENKGYTIVGEFNCAGFNTNSFLKYLGGVNKGRPNAQDLERAEAFARSLRDEHLRSQISPAALKDLE